MNQDKITSFLKFVSQHQPEFSIMSDSNIGYCLHLSCGDCCLDNTEECNSAEVTNEELKYLQKNYPEYFI